MTNDAKRIDVHHHILPEFYVERLKSIGVTKALGVDLSTFDWSPEKALEIMDKMEIETGIASISDPGIWFAADAEFSVSLARACNEYMAELRDKYPGRFGGFACIPLPDKDAALEELHYALEELKLDGVCLMTHYNGVYLGDPGYDAVFSELNRRKTVCFVHPIDPPVDAIPNIDLPTSVIEAPFDTTRAFANLMLQGVLNKYPDISYILAHGGGAVPYLAWRFAAGVKYQQKEGKPGFLRTAYDFYIKNGPESGLNDLRRLYYDTALVSGSYALDTLYSFAGPDHIVFGSDLPFAKIIAPKVADNIKRYTRFPDQDYEAIDRGNCSRLFPQFDAQLRKGEAA
ncbi:amidohydrolase family protein [uncultured Ruegeria sp.]|uniref:amidohydrolase family protein n=1 Tax=uncultured Ruegeria sp. TaxID=259304 RepID=UPI002603928F|nr:amidohydrolase family protein [uncultured Ruegeria sp.]